MRFLVDTNLPRALAHWIAAKDHVCEHVLDLGLGQSKDAELWRRAGETQAIIISKDEDFADFARRWADGPSVVWLRTGNGTTRELLSYLDPVWAIVEARLEAGDRLVEVR